MIDVPEGFHLHVSSLNLLDVRKAAITAAIAECGNNKSAAARALGIDRRTLYRFMKQHKIETTVRLLGQDVTL